MFKKACLLLVIMVISNFPTGVIGAEQPQIQQSLSSDANTVQKTDVSSATVFSDKCAFIFKDFVSDKGLVNYKSLKRKRPELNKLLNDLHNFDPNEYSRLSKDDKTAFWINVYNLQMLRIIVDNYPIESTRILRIIWPPDSIRHISGIWDQYKFIVMDEEFTLQEIDQRFFRREFDDPRTFLAITYASLSSPPLRNEPYYGHKLNAQLDDQTRRFLTDSLAFKIDAAKSKVYLSAIFEQSWYGQYFLSKYGTDKKFKTQPPAVAAILNFIIRYIPEPDVRFLETANYSVEFMNYNWRLNE